MALQARRLAGAGRLVRPVLRRRRPLPSRDRPGGLRPALDARLHDAVHARPSQGVRARAAGGAPHARGAEPRLLHLLGLRGGRFRNEDGAGLPPHPRPRPPPALRVARAGVPRRQHGRRRAVGHGQQPAHLRRRHAGRALHAPHRAARKHLRARPARDRRRPRRGPAAHLRADRRRQHRRGVRRADRGQLRLPAAAGGLPRPHPRDLRPARHPAGVRRGDHRLGPDGRALRRSEVRRDAGPADHGQGDHQRRAADGRDRGEAGALRHHHRGRPRAGHRVLPRVHLLGASGIVRRGPGDDGHLRARGADGPCRRDVPVLPRRRVFAARPAVPGRHPRHRDDGGDRAVHRRAGAGSPWPCGAEGAVRREPEPEVDR